MRCRSYTMSPKCNFRTKIIRFNKDLIGSCMSIHKTCTFTYVCFTDRKKYNIVILVQSHNGS